MRIDWVRELTSAGLRKRVQQKHTDAVNPSAPASPQPKQSSTSPSKTDQLALVSDSEKSVIKHEEKDGPKLQDQDQGCYISDVTFERLRRFTETAYRSYILGRPTADHLLTLSKVNVFRAFEMIIGLMGMSPSPDWMHDDALSPFTTQGPGVAEENTLPPSLRPTKLQKTLSHHPWLDFFPIPKIRDNLLRAGELFDDEALCVDIMGFWDSAPNSANCSLLVWGEPTDPESWEVTEEFLRKWPWVVRGCPEVLQSTNYWRRQRGETMLFRYV